MEHKIASGRGMGKHIFLCLFTMVIALVMLLSPSWGTAATQRLERAAPGDCAACHGSQKVLSAAHVKTKGMDLAACRKCHVGETASLMGKMPLGHTHLLQGVGCAKCHGNAKTRKAVETARCLSCHVSGEKVAERTAKTKENPHDSPHYGTTLDCNLCHRQHAKSKNYCTQCHTFKVVVP